MFLHLCQPLKYIFYDLQGPRGPPGATGFPGPDGRRVRNFSTYASVISFFPFHRDGMVQKDILEKWGQEEIG